MTLHVSRRTLIVSAAAVCFAAVFAAAWGAKTAMPPEAHDFVMQRGIMENRPDGKFHPSRHVKRGELAAAIYETVEEMVRDERLRGPAGAPGTQGPPGAAASDEDIGRTIKRYALEVSNDFTDIKADIADLQDTEGTLEERIAKLETAVKALQDQTAALDGTATP